MKNWQQRKSFQTLDLQKTRQKGIVKISEMTSVQCPPIPLSNQFCYRQHKTKVYFQFSESGLSLVESYVTCQNADLSNCDPKSHIEFLSRSHLITQSLFEMGFQDLASNSVIKTEACFCNENQALALARQTPLLAPLQPFLKYGFICRPFNQ